MRRRITKVRIQDTESRIQNKKQRQQNRWLYIFLFWLLAPGIWLLACSGQNTSTDNAPGKGTAPRPALNAAPIILSILPVESAGAMYKRFLPLKYYLERSLNVPVVIRIAKDYESAINELGSGQVHMAYLDPAAYCEVRARYRGKVTPLVRAVAKENTSSRSVLVAKSGTAIEKIVDVREKRLAFGSRQSSFSYLIPLAMLNDVGIGIEDLASVDYLEQEDRVALSVLVGNHEVGAMSELVAAKYIDDGLRIIKRSEIVPQFVLCSSIGLSPEQRNGIVKNLTSAHGRETLSAIDKDMEFVAAEDRDFDVIRVMIKNLTGKNYIEYGPKTIKVAVLPLYSAVTIYNKYDPLMRYLSQLTGYEFKLVIPKDFDDFVGTVKRRAVDFSYQNPYIFALIDREVDITPLVTTVDEYMEAGDRFRGVIITRSDSPVKDVKELRNKKVLITSPKSAGGYLSQRLFLQQMGIDTERDMKIIDAKRQEKVILGVYKGEADAGFVRESALDVVKEEFDMKKIRVLARTEPLPNWPFALCRELNPAVVQQVKRILTGLDNPEILGPAGIKRFKVANEAEFNVLKKY
ncbi:MAG: phosphate/phosphite/phosphonate ABC transporter substrate-binding protein [Nitrospirota bacterium]